MVDAGTLLVVARCGRLRGMSGRIRHIDGLRGIAVLAVVLFHAGVHNPALTAGRTTTLSFILRQGCHGVDLFFVLSGFCLAYPSLAAIHDRNGSTFHVAPYAARRIIRILPPYYGAIAAFVALGYALLAAHIALPGPMAREALTGEGIIKQALFLDRDRQFLDASFWSLAIEFRWYFAFPLALWLWLRHRRAFCVVALGAVAAAATRLWSVDLFFLPFFMAGIVAADLYVTARHFRWIVLGAAATIILAMATTFGGGWYFYENGPFWGLAMFFVVVAVGSTGVLRCMLSANWLVAIGGASYGIYLIHEPFVALIEQTATPIFGNVASYLLSVGGAVVLGCGFSFVAERPFVKSVLRDKLITKLEHAFPLVLHHAGIPSSIEFGDTPSHSRHLKAAG
jgi:peptidoglycan/LPS O-acetylase OafA/YrhL